MTTIKCAVLWLLCCPLAMAASAPVVTFFSPASQDNPFFEQIIDIMSVAASKLDLELDVIYGGHDPIVMKQQAQALFSRARKPDYLLLVNHRNATAEIMQQADDMGIKTLLFNGAYPPSTVDKFRRGEQALEHWIGQVLPDENQSGWLLAQRLVERARQSPHYRETGRVKMVGINGPTRSPTTQQRHDGLLAYVASQSDVDLQQVVHADWDQELARAKGLKLLQRYRDTSVIWASADYMAVGAAEAIVQNGQTPGKDVFSAGVDWLPVVFEPINKGALVGTVGGHIFDGAWAMVVVHDHSNGVIDEFIDERTQFYFADKASMPSIATMMQARYWHSIDFNTFSRTQNGPEHQYNFGASLILPTP